MSDIKPDPAFAHSAGSGGEATVPVDETEEHSTEDAARAVPGGVETGEELAQQAPHGAEIPPADLPNPGV